MDNRTSKENYYLDIADAVLQRSTCLRPRRRDQGSYNNRNELLHVPPPDHKCRHRKGHHPHRQGQVHDSRCRRVDKKRRLHVLDGVIAKKLLYPLVQQLFYTSLQVNKMT